MNQKEIDRILSLAEYIKDQLFSIRLYQIVFSWWQQEKNNFNSPLMDYGMLLIMSRNALLTTYFMELSKIYDYDSKAGNFHKLMKCFRKDTEVKTLKDFELSDTKIKQYNKYCKIPFDIIKMNNFIEQYKAFELLMEKIIIQRDKIYAHNDKNMDSIIERNQISISEFNELLEFSEMFVDEIIRCIKGCVIKKHVANPNQLALICSVLDIYDKYHDEIIGLIDDIQERTDENI